MEVVHEVSKIAVDESSQGLVALIDFGINSTEKDTNCGSLPPKF